MNRTDFALLGLLAAERRSGYDLRQTVRERLAHFWNESLGNIYPRLKELHEQRLISKEVERQEGRPDRHVYALTEEGRAELSDWFEQPIRPTPPRQELLLKVFLGRHAPPGVLARQVAQYRSQRAADLARFEQIHGRIQAESELRPDATFVLITLRAGIHAARAALDWADETLPLLNDL